MSAQGTSLPPHGIPQGVGRKIYSQTSGSKLSLLAMKSTVAWLAWGGWTSHAETLEMLTAAARRAVVMRAIVKNVLDLIGV